MKLYQNILLAIDLHPTCDEAITQRALNFVQLAQAKLFVVHAIEHINAYGVAQAYPAVIDLEKEMVEEAQKQLSKFLSQYNIPLEQQFVEIGSPKAVIFDKAKELECDLIILGSHGRHGWSFLFGSTTTAVIQHAACDVLAVPIPH